MIFQRQRRSAVAENAGAYAIQPRASKWVCTHCGRMPVEPKDRKKGEPRFELRSFDGLSGLERHRLIEHGMPTYRRPDNKRAR